MDFETYWETVGSRIQVESHEERARLAWDAAWDEGYTQGNADGVLEGMELND